MSAAFDTLRNRFRQSHVIGKLIVVNVVIFLAVNLLITFLQLFKLDTSWIIRLSDLLAVPASVKTLVQQPWSIITYQFMHHNLLHILFNMLWLWWMGKILSEFIGNKKITGLYITGGISGGLLYILFYNIFPLFSDMIHVSYAIGASASVLAITVAAATLVPDYSIFLLFFGAVKLKYIALVTILLDLISISGSNAGGHIAHLGGAAFGFFYIKQLQRGTDWGKWVQLIGEKISSLAQPKPKLKVTWRKNESGQKQTGSPDQETIDRILDKISRSGYSSLTSGEKEILFKASNQRKRE